MCASATLRASGGLADARNILSILAMCASIGTSIEVEVYDPDEFYAACAIESIFNECSLEPPSDNPRLS